MKLKKISVVLLMLLLTATFVLPASADSLDSIPYHNYNYYDDMALDTKAVYTPKKQISGADISGKGFQTLNYVFGFQDELFILDGGSGTIYILDTAYRLKRTVTDFENGGEKVTFMGAEGLFVDESGIYIADTANKRVICTDGKTVTKIITQPDSSLIPENYDFAPVRIIRDGNGYLYVLCKGSYYGMMMFSDEYAFLGFYGANQVEVSLRDAITDLVISLFETEEKHNASLQALPFQMVDIALDSEGFITTISDQTVGQIKRLGTNGTNNLVKSDQFGAVGGDSYNFADNPVTYQDKSDRYVSYITEKFVAVAADADGYIYAVDTSQGRIFMYNTACELMTVFGGGLGNGTQVGTFITPNAATCFGNDLLVSDQIAGVVTVFSLTDYGKILKTANILSLQSDYIAAEPYWQKIYDMDRNCQQAYAGLAKAALEKGEYRQAMRLAKQGGDRVTYAAAFKLVRNQFVSEHFVFIGIAVLLLAAGPVYLLRLTRKKEIVLIKNAKIRTGVTACIHPFRSFDGIKNFGQASIILSTALLALYYISTVTLDLHIGFMYGQVSDSYNALYTLLGTVGVVLIYTLTNWAISVLLSGRGTLKEIYCATCCCLTPMIVCNFLYLIFSHTVVATTNSGIETIVMIFRIYTVILLLLSITVIQDFTFFKAVGIAIATVVGMCIIAFIIFIMLSLGQDTVNFVVSIINEISMR